MRSGFLWASFEKFKPFSLFRRPQSGYEIKLYIMIHHEIMRKWEEKKKKTHLTVDHPRWKKILSRAWIVEWGGCILVMVFGFRTLPYESHNHNENQPSWLEGPKTTSRSIFKSLIPYSFFEILTNKFTP